MPQAMPTMLDPADCGPAFIALPQDVQAEAFDFPAAFFEPRGAHASPGRGPIAARWRGAVGVLRGAERPLMVAGGGVHYSLAEAELAAFAEHARHPGRRDGRRQVARVAADHPCYAGPIGVIGAEARQPPRRRGRRRDRGRHPPAGLHHRLVDGVPATTTCGSSASTPPASTPASTAPLPVVGDARRDARRARRGPRRLAGAGGVDGAVAAEVAHALGVPRLASARRSAEGAVTYAQVVAAVNAAAPAGDDYALTASGGFPGELNAGWRSREVATFDCEYGFSCMGYEISGGWGAAMARSHWPRTVRRSCSSATART